MTCKFRPNYTPNFIDYKIKNEIPYKPTKKEKNFIYLAYQLSLNSDVKSGKHAAIVLDDELNIVCTSVNNRTHHAEKNAVDLLKNFDPNKEYTIITVRGNYLGNITNGRPCFECYKSMLEGNIKEIIYSSDNNCFKKIYL